MQLESFIQAGIIYSSWNNQTTFISALPECTRHQNFLPKRKYFVWYQLSIQFFPQTSSTKSSFQNNTGAVEQIPSSNHGNKIQIEHFIVKCCSYVITAAAAAREQVASAMDCNQ